MSKKSKMKAKEAANAEPTEEREDVEIIEELEDVEVIEEEKPTAPEVEEEESIRLQLMRLKADFDNFRKRQVRERAEWITRANEDLFKELLPVIDHYEMGLKSAEEHQIDSSVTDGFKLVHNQLLAVLKKSNVTPIETEGAAFDPHHHEALTHMPSDLPSETIVQEFRRGYMLGDKLLRAAQVVVSSGPANETEVED